MSCGCNQYKPVCSSSCGCGPVCAPQNCAEVCTVLYTASSFNVPAVGSNAVLSAPKLKNIQVGSYLYNPLYGAFLVSSFNTSNSQVTITNTGYLGNAAPGTIVPACTQLIVGPTPTSSPVINFVTSVTNAGGGMLNTAPVFGVSHYDQDFLNRRVEGLVQFTTTLSGTPGAYLQLNLPVSVNASEDVSTLLVGHGWYSNGSASFLPVIQRVGSTQNYLIGVQGGGTFVNGSYTFQVRLNYLGV